MAHAFAVLIAEKLRAEDAGARNGAENAEVENEEELVCDGDAGHGHGAGGADHDVVEQIDKLGDAVLDHDGQGQSHDPFIKAFISDVIAQHGISLGVKSV